MVIFQDSSIIFLKYFYIFDKYWQRIWIIRTSRHFSTNLNQVQEIPQIPTVLECWEKYVIFSTETFLQLPIHFDDLFDFEKFRPFLKNITNVWQTFVKSKGIPAVLINSNCWLFSKISWHFSTLLNHYLVNLDNFKTKAKKCQLLFIILTQSKCCPLLKMLGYSRTIFA